MIVIPYQTRYVREGPHRVKEAPVFLLLVEGLGVRCGGAVLHRTSGDLCTTVAGDGETPEIEQSNLSGLTCFVSASDTLWPIACPKGVECKQVR